MDMEKMIQDMEDVVRSYREQLMKNDYSTLSNIGNSAKMSFEGMKASMGGHDVVHQSIENFKAAMDDFESALKAGDRTRAAGILDTMESFIDGVRAAAERVYY